MTKNILYYIHDPMCSWCWGFRPAWTKIQQALAEQLPNQFSIQYVVGGLAPDSDVPMDDATKAYVQKNWARIQEYIPNTEFNYNFWTECIPRRSTYPACRAVIAAKLQGAHFEQAMVDAIQQAYYLNAKNPSNNDVLFRCAEHIGLELDRFLSAVHSHKVEELLQQDIILYHQLAAKAGVSGFPSLALSVSEQLISVPIDYNHFQNTIDFIIDCLSVGECGTDGHAPSVPINPI